MLKKRKLLNFEVSDLCLGCSVLNPKNLKSFLDLGGNFLDTSPLYQDGESEKIIGKFGNRNDFIIGTKVGLDSSCSGLSTTSILKSVDNSLKRLKTDYIDILWIHVWDGTLEFACIFENLLKSGKVKAVGASNTPAWVISMYKDLFKFVQIEYNFNNRSSEFELIPMANKLNLNLVGRSIFDKGLVFNNFSFLDVSLLTLQWLKNKNILPIVRTGSKQNLIKNVNNYYKDIHPSFLSFLDKGTKPDTIIHPHNVINSVTVQRILKNIK